MKDKQDRRTQRTREALQNAFSTLLKEKHYDDILIQEITDLANVGRTTFYLHYANKDMLFLDMHQQPMRESLGTSNTREMWLSKEPPVHLVAFFTQMQQQGRVESLLPTHANSESAVMITMLHRMTVQALIANLREIFDERQSEIPFATLAEAMTGVQIRMVAQWMDSRDSISAYSMARTVHLLQRSMLVGILNLTEQPDTPHAADQKHSG